MNSYLLCFSITEKEKKKRKEEGKSRTTLPERPLTEVKAETRAEEVPEKKKEKPKSLRTTAPSHAKFRSTGKAVGWLCRAIDIHSQWFVISNSEEERLKEKLGACIQGWTI